jgi:hypothetical protein
MSYNQVGSVGIPTSGASGASVTPVWGTGETRAGGDLLLCWVSGVGHSSVPATPDGWSVAAQVSQGSPLYTSSTIFCRVAAGGDSAPTITGVAGITWSATLATLIASAVPTSEQLVNQALGITLTAGDIIDVYPAIPTTSKTVNADGSLS